MKINIFLFFYTCKCIIHITFFELLQRKALYKYLLLFNLCLRFPRNSDGNFKRNHSRVGNTIFNIIYSSASEQTIKCCCDEAFLQDFLEILKGENLEICSLGTKCIVLYRFYTLSCHPHYDDFENISNFIEISSGLKISSISAILNIHFRAAIKYQLLIELSAIIMVLSYYVLIVVFKYYCS